MNKFLPLASCALFLASVSQAQNLVPNPSFEDFITCPMGTSEMFQSVPWTQPVGHTGTSDYFNACHTSFFVGVPASTFADQAARTGVAYAGFIATELVSGDSREYIQAPLASPLVVGTNYCVRFYVSLAEASAVSCDGMGAYFSTSPNVGSGTLPIAFTAQVIDTTIINNYTEWQEVYGEFVADQPYGYITIGNFAPQGQNTTGAGAPPTPPTTFPPINQFPFPYYLVDDIYVGESAQCPVPCELQFTNVSTAADCNINNGIAAVTVAGGSGNYTYMWENGATTESLSGVGYGLHEVIVSDGPGCNRSYNAFVDQNTTLAVTFPPGIIQCASDSVNEIDIDVTGGTTPYTFLWSTGDTTEDLDSIPGGAYSVVVTDSAGCMFTDSTELTSLFGSELTVVETDETCAGANNGSLFVQPGGTFPIPPSSYLWSNGGTTAGIYNLAPGTYTVEATDFFGCISTLTGVVGIGTGSFSVNISQQDNMLYATTSPNYQWHLNGEPILGATQQTYNITESGNYYVVASGGGACIDTSNIIEATYNPDNIIENTLLENVLVYPNPANENLNVVITLSSAEATEIKLLDVTGRVVWTFAKTEKTTETKCSIPVSNFAEGVYFVKASAGAEQQ
jgi:hypothetical protein